RPGGRGLGTASGRSGPDLWLCGGNRPVGVFPRPPLDALRPPPGGGDARSVFSRGHRSTLSGLTLEAETPVGRVTVTSCLIGEHNVLNLLGAIAAGVALGLDPDRIARALTSVTAVPGRFEQIDDGQDFLVVVDY